MRIIIQLSTIFGHSFPTLMTRIRESNILTVSTLTCLNRFWSGFTLIPMMWAVKNDLDADARNLDRKTVRGFV